jgi:ubiquitin C-terminal hydrolase
MSNLLHNKLYSNGLCGIANIGNTCWISSILQCLSHTNVLKDYFLSNAYKEDINPNRETQHILVETYKNLINALWTVEGVINPTPFIKLLGCINEEYLQGGQHDGQEFLLLLIDEIHKGISYEISLRINGTIKSEIDRIERDSLIIWRNEFKQNYSLIVQELYGQYIATTYCDLCNHTYFKYDVFNHISLPITEECTTIYDCFDVFTENEVLDDDNRLMCNNCNQLTNATKNISIWRSPNVLLISFKRFDMMGNKIDTMIDYPLEELDLHKYVNGYSKYRAKYNLYAICNHFGTMDYGHYTAYCKHQDTWYDYDDTLVNEISFENVVTNNAYILFYVKA